MRQVEADERLGTDMIRNKAFATGGLRANWGISTYVAAFICAAVSFSAERAEAQSTGSTATAEQDVVSAGLEVGTEPSKRSRIGYGRLIVNDLLGDGKDRWRTGSYASSRIYGYGWEGSAPADFGQLLEVRLLGQVIAPESLASPAAGDRAFAGALSVGLHTHVERSGWQYSIGGDLVVIGPQTGLDGFQNWLHGWTNGDRHSDQVVASQIGNKIRPTLVAEVGRDVALSETARLRPFAELRAGDETLMRLGFDMHFGATGLQDLLVRDPVSGQRYRTMYEGKGTSFVIGGDVAYVANSVYLPSDGAELKDTRSRLRAGVHWQGDNVAAFYGLTYLGEEFEGQDEGQVIGAVRLRITF